MFDKAVLSEYIRKTCIKEMPKSEKKDVLIREQKKFFTFALLIYISMF